MLRLRMAVAIAEVEAMATALAGHDGVRRIVRTVGEAGDVVLAADVAPMAADELGGLLHELGVSPEDYVLVREEVVAPSARERGAFAAGAGFAWVEVVGQARAYSRPLARYLALMSVAATIAALGVITDNPILIVGAMAVSPDLLPICATCVGLVGGQYRLARRALATLLVGMLLVMVAAAVLTALLDVTGILPSDFVLSEGGLGNLANTDYTTVLIALAAGVAAILSFETRAASAVGVAISITTIPASAFFGVAIGVGEGRNATGALLVLAVNVVVLIASGSLTLVAQRRAAAETIGDAPPRR